MTAEVKPLKFKALEEIRTNLHEVNAKLDVIIRSLPLIAKAVSDSDLRKFEEQKRQWRKKSVRKFVGLENWLARVIAMS